MPVNVENELENELDKFEKLEADTIGVALQLEIEKGQVMTHRDPLYEPYETVLGAAYGVGAYESKENNTGKLTVLPQPLTIFMEELDCEICVATLTDSG